MYSFKDKYTISERYAEANRVLEKYPERIPVICERSNSAPRACPIIDKNKYLIPKELTIGEFMYVIRKRLHLSPEKAIFLFINGLIPSSSNVFGQLYNYYKDIDDFLYITYSFENTFG